jgi:hypothetical protein
VARLCRPWALQKLSAIWGRSVVDAWPRRWPVTRCRPPAEAAICCVRHCILWVPGSTRGCEDPRSAHSDLFIVGVGSRHLHPSRTGIGLSASFPTSVRAPQRKIAPSVSCYVRTVVEDDASQPTLFDKMLGGAAQFLNHLYPLGLVNRAVLRHLAYTANAFCVNAARKRSLNVSCITTRRSCSVSSCWP